MRNAYYYSIAQAMADIETEWERRKVTDATAEEEFEDYKKLMYCFAEFVLGWR